ncbi:MAG: ribokinase [Candidatus Methanomethyliaceae archaeon]
MICVLGSVNMDCVFEIERMPRLGETVCVKTSTFVPGGKGANQAVACARLGAKVTFLGKVGRDLFGDKLLSSLSDNNVGVDLVGTVPGVPTGIAVILLHREGDNSILYAPGANACLDPDYIDSAIKHIAQSSILLLQLEVPLQSNAYLLSKLQDKKPLVILDPAPAQELDGIPPGRIDIITPNHVELQMLTGCSDIPTGGRKLLERGFRCVICKDGGNGAWLVNKDGVLHFPAFPIQPVDTTAAGDAFNAGLAVALEWGYDIVRAIRVANAAGALACTKRGALPSLPHLEDVKNLLKIGAG